MFDALGYKSWLETLDAWNYLVQIHIPLTLCRSRIEYMLSHALTGRSRVISGHLRDIGGYQSLVGYICYHGKESWGNVNGGQAESMSMWTQVIPSAPIKDHTIVGTSDKIERMTIT